MRHRMFSGFLSQCGGMGARDAGPPKCGQELTTLDNSLTLLIHPQARLVRTLGALPRHLAPRMWAECVLRIAMAPALQ